MSKHTLPTLLLVPLATSLVAACSTTERPEGFPARFADVRVVAPIEGLLVTGTTLTTTVGPATPARPGVGNQVFEPTRKDLPFEPSERDRATIGTGFTGHREAPEGSGYGRGLTVAGVQPDGALGQAGMKDGDLLLVVGPIRMAADDPDPVGTLRDAMADLEPDTQAPVVYARGGEIHEVDVTLGRRPPAFDHTETPASWLEPAALSGFDPTLKDAALALEGASATFEDVAGHNRERFARTDWFRLRETVQAQMGLFTQESLAEALVRATQNDLAFGATLAAGEAFVVEGTLLPPPYERMGLTELVDEVESFVTGQDELLRELLTDWSEEEREYFTEGFPLLVERLDEGEYLYSDENVERQRTIRRVVNLLTRVNRGIIENAARDTCRFLDAIMPALERVVRENGGAGLLVGRDTPAGRIEIWGTGSQRHTNRCAFRFDLAGNDDYLDNAGRADLSQPVSIHIDVTGDDQYGATSLGCQGAAMGGVGVLVDRSGDDQYLATGWSQGVAVAGFGLLLDSGGNDTYRGLDCCQGAAFVGSGVLRDLAGDDTYSGDRFCQGVGFGAGVGVLTDDRGDDRYACTGRYGSEYGEPGLFSGWGQGVGFGFRHLTSGGIGVLNDIEGDDVYEAGNFSQGGGYFFAWGILEDGAGDDLYRGSRYAMGYAAHQAQGTFIERAGNDRYQSVSNVANGLSWDETCVVFHDYEGDDVYETRGFSLGAAAHNGMVLFLDDEGDDWYRGVPGRANPNTYHGGHSFSLVVDAGGGRDVYGDKPHAEWNDRVSWKQDRCYVLDLPATWESLTDLVRPPAPEKDAAK